MIIEIAADVTLSLDASSSPTERIFQALFMLDMMRGSHRENVRRSFLSELLSMNMMMAGGLTVLVEVSP